MHVAIRQTAGGAIPFDLDRGMVDTETVFQFARQPAQEGIVAAAAGHYQMCSEGAFSRAHAPDVEIVNSFDS